MTEGNQNKKSHRNNQRRRNRPANGDQGQQRRSAQDGVASKSGPAHKSAPKNKPGSTDVNSSSNKSSHKNFQSKKKRPQNRRGRNYRNRRRKPPLSPMDRLNRLFFQIFDNYCAAKKKYFELYFRADPRQKDKLHRIYIQSLEKLHQFTKSLDEEQLKYYEKLFPSHPEDNQFSHQNPDDEIATSVDWQGPWEDPHKNLIQKERSSFIEDKEESSGDMADLEKYKSSLG